ncbi:MAG: TonB-dependent receptor [Acidobacteriota bacterium]
MLSHPFPTAGPLLLALGLAVPFNAPVLATDDAAQDKPQATFEATVSVTSSLPELIATQDVPADTLTGGRGADLSEQLRTVPGLDAVRRGSINLEPSLRGLQEEQIATLVDGTRTFAAGPARMDSNLSHVGAHAADGVSIVKGPYALAWAAGALSAIDLRTHRPSFGEAVNGSLGVSYADNGERTDAHAAVSGGGDRYYYALSAGRRDGGDFEDGDGFDIPGDYESTEARWRVGTQLGGDWSLDYSGGYQEQNDIDYPGRLLDATYFYARSHALELRRNGDGHQVMVQLYANRKDHLMNNDEKPTGRDMPGRIPPFALDIDLPTESNTAGGRFRLDFDPRGETSWSAGADYYRVEQTAERTVARRSNGFVIFRDIVWPDADISDLGGWVQLTHRTGRTRLGATLRLDAVDAEAGEVSEFFRANVNGDLDQSETHVSAAVSAAVELNERWTLETGVGRAVRTATALERYSDRFPATKFQIAAEFLGNPELDPETSHELNLGLHRRGSKLSAAVEGFYRQIDDYITVTPDPSLPKRLPLSPPTVFRYVNGDRATYYGAELRIDHRAHDRFTWRADLTWVRATDDELDEPVLGITPLRLRAAGRFEAVRDRLFLDAGVTIIDDQDRVATSRFEQPTDGATLVDFGVELELGDFTLDVDVLNVTDETYANPLNAPNPFTRQRVNEIGRSVRAGVRYRY